MSGRVAGTLGEVSVALRAKKARGRLFKGCEEGLPTHGQQDYVVFEWILEHNNPSSWEAVSQR